MTEEQAERLNQTILAHGDSIGGNLVHLKNFLKHEREEQQAFLAEQRIASDKAQATAKWTTVFAAIAAGATAIAAGVSAYADYQSLPPKKVATVQPSLKSNTELWSEANPNWTDVGANDPVSKVHRELCKDDKNYGRIPKNDPRC